MPVVREATIEFVEPSPGVPEEPREAETKEEGEAPDHGGDTMTKSKPTGADKHNGEKERQKILAENKGCQILNMDGYPCGKKVVDINEMHLDHECHDYDKYPWVMVRVCKKHME